MLTKNTEMKRVKKSHPNSARLNNFIIKKLAEANDKLLEMEGNEAGFSAQIITNEIKGKHKVTTFFEVAEPYLKHLQDTGQVSRYNSENPRFNHLKKFQVYLKHERNNGDRSIVNAMVIIRTVYNLAIREGVVDRKHYPFGKGGIVIRFPQSLKIGLSREELTALEEIELESKLENHARNVWLVSFYFAGMRISDVLKLKWSVLRL